MQNLLDMKVLKERDRWEQQKQMEMSREEHSRAMKRMQHEARLQEERETAESRMVTAAVPRGPSDRSQGVKDAEEKQAIARRIEDDERYIRHLQQMKSMDVDVTQVLVAREHVPQKQVIIQGDAGAKLHLHENA